MDRPPLGSFLTLLLTVLSLQACSLAIKGNVPFSYIPSLSAAEPTTYRLGVGKLSDLRPSEDRESTESIADVDEKLTAKLLQDFRASNLFKEITFPSKKDRDDLILTGEIRRFYWNASLNKIVFVPVLGLIIYFGAPTHFVEASAHLRVRLVNPKTDQVVGEYDKFAFREKSYSLYDTLDVGEAGAELSECFREVAKLLKEAIAADLKKIQLTKVTVQSGD